MSDISITLLLVGALFLILGSGVWIGLTLTGVAWIGMQLFSSRPAGDAMAVTTWGSASSWTLTALPLFVWMGEILFRTRLSQDMFKGLAPWLENVPGRLLHTNVIGCAIFAYNMARKFLSGLHKSATNFFNQIFSGIDCFFRSIFKFNKR